ncbi:MAG: ABC transporter ATP-binding protein [Acidobacteriota bacterium]
MLNAESLTVKYNAKEVLSDISLDLKAGEIVALLGPNGAGKTTLLRTLNGTVPVDKGNVILDGRLLKSFSRREIARKIAVVAQENETKFPVSVMEFVLTGRFSMGTTYGWESDSDRGAANRAIALCGLSEYRYRNMNSLSGGERQRVHLARALAVESEYLLLDEPTANLDLESQALMFRIVRMRCKEFGSAAMVITHDLNLASALTDRVVLLSNGRIHSYGSPNDSLTIKNIERVFRVKVMLDENPLSGTPRITATF